MNGSLSLYRASITTTMPVHDRFIIEICTADKKFKRKVLVLAKRENAGTGCGGGGGGGGGGSVCSRKGGDGRGDAASKSSAAAKDSVVLVVVVAAGRGGRFGNKEDEGRQLRQRPLRVRVVPDDINDMPFTTLLSTQRGEWKKAFHLCHQNCNQGDLGSIITSIPLLQRFWRSPWSC